MQDINLLNNKYQYLLKLDKENYSQKTKDIKNIISEPLFSEINFHEEEIPSLNKINSVFEEIDIDLTYLKQNVKDMAIYLNKTLEDTRNHLTDININVIKERERLYALNLLNGNDIDIIKNLDSTNNQYDIYAAKEKLFKTIDFKTKNVSGNGYAGNDYVLIDGKEFLKNSIKSDNETYLSDGSLSTYYEYSKLLTSNDISNFEYTSDSNYVRCSIELFSNEEFNCIEIYSDFLDTYLNSIEISHDGYSYSTLEYEDIKFNYIPSKFKYPNSGILSFPNSKYIRLNLTSKHITDDLIGFEKNDDVEINNNFKRNVLRINNIFLYAKQYVNKTNYYMPNILSGNPFESVFLYADEIIPDDTSIEYILTLNDKNYSVVPINSDRNGTKIIKYMSIDINEEYIEEINFKPSNISLNINIYTKNDNVTPYIYNLRLMTGR